MAEDATSERMRRLGIRDVDLEETFLRSNTSFRATCDELLLKEAIHTYEKIDHSHFCAFAVWLDAGVLLKRTRDQHNYNASNHCHYATPAAYYDDNDNAYGRLLRAGGASNSRRKTDRRSSFSFFTIYRPIFPRFALLPPPH